MGRFFFREDIKSKEALLEVIVKVKLKDTWCLKSSISNVAAVNFMNSMVYINKLRLFLSPNVWLPCKNKLNCLLPLYAEKELLIFFKPLILCDRFTLEEWPIQKQWVVSIVSCVCLEQKGFKVSQKACLKENTTCSLLDNFIPLSCHFCNSFQLTKCFGKRMIWGRYQIQAQFIH